VVRVLERSADQEARDVARLMSETLGFDDTTRVRVEQGT
jgi:hypothetical protein